MIFTDDEFYAIMDDAMDSIPDDLFRRITNVSFDMQHEPAPDQKSLCSSESYELLGLFTGVALPHQGYDPGSFRLPNRIWVFKGPIERIARDEASCRELIRTTLLHEIGHHFGMSDAEMAELGY